MLWHKGGSHCPNFSAYVHSLGAWSPTFVVASKSYPDPNDLKNVPGIINLWVHELLHVLGIGHTHRRPGMEEIGLSTLKFY